MDSAGVSKYRLPDDILEQVNNAKTKEEADAIQMKWLEEFVWTGKVKPYNQEGQ
jgi:hypothetical protein